MSALSTHPTAALLKDPGHFLMLGGGLGLIRFAPGTFGSVLGVVVYYGLEPLDLGLYWTIVAVFFLLGVPLAARTARALGVQDHPGVVWDEVVGILVALGLAGPGLVSVVLGFAAFRMFDIAKPGPIGWLDQNVHGGLGVMVDDLAAGLIAGFLVELFNYIS